MWMKGWLNEGKTKKNDHVMTGAQNVSTDNGVRAVFAYDYHEYDK